MNLRLGIFGRKLGTILILAALPYSCAPKDDAVLAAKSPAKPRNEIVQTTARPSKPLRSAPEDSAAQFIRKKMQSIIVPVIAFDDTSVEEAIDFLRIRSIELDPDKPKSKPQGISFIVRKPRQSDESAALQSAPADGLGDVPQAGAVRLTMHARNISLWDALHRVADQAGLKVEITGRGIELKAR